jgi:hypothetical protein
MAGQLSRRALRFSRWAAVLLGATLTAALAAAAPPADQSAPQDSRPLQEVQVTASKLDRRTLKRVAIEFVKLHGAVSPVIHQIGRWRMDVCPWVTGLNPAGSAFVSHRVVQVAQSVGAPTPSAGKKCPVNVEIVFTPQPQELLDHIAKTYPMLLGSSRSAGDTIFHRAIQSWYLTGTRAVDGLNLPNSSFGNAFTCHCTPDMQIQPGIPPPLPTGLTVDVPGSDGTAVTGLAGSYFAKGLTNEFIHVLVIVDTRKVAGDSLRSLSDYIAMLALTRIGSLDGCNELPSIIDLLSSGCDVRDKPQELTDADTAYLEALYSADLEANLNIEQGDVRDRMVKGIMGR